jgi:glycosyltransferase involved in cell wall biosynthesis
MACGAPVVASNVSSVPEIAGDAAVLLDPSDVQGMAAAVERLLTDAAYRETLVRSGFAHASGYRWDAAAKATIEILLGAARR